METDDQTDGTPQPENAYQVIRSCIFDLQRDRRNMLDNPELLAYVDNKIAVLEQVQIDMIAYDKLRAALKAALV